MRKHITQAEADSLKEAGHKAFKSINEDTLGPHWKKHSPVRSKLSKKEDIAHIKARKFKTYRKRMELDKMIDRAII